MSEDPTLKAKLETIKRKQKYKELIEKGSEISENLENQAVLETFHKILDIITSCENVSADFVKEGKIENASDYLMDAQILKMSHELMGSAAEKMGNSEFSAEEFAAALKNLFIADNGDDFDKLAEIAVVCCRSVQFSVPLLGAVDFEAGQRPEKIRKEAHQRVKKNTEPTKAPTNVKQLTKNNQGAEKINAVRIEIQRICRERGADCIPYFELVCDPQNFMKSVDIAFQISFLVRDGFLGLKKIDGEPHVFLYDPDPMTQQTQREHPSDTVQCVVSLNPSLWRDKVKNFKIRKPLLTLDDENKGANGAEMEVDSESN